MVNQTTWICRACGNPNSSADLTCSRCGAAFPAQQIHPEPFSVYPPPFSEPSVEEPCVAPPVVPPQPPVSLPEPVIEPILGPIDPVLAASAAPPPPTPVVPNAVAAESGNTVEIPAPVAANNELDIPGFLRRRAVQRISADPTFVLNQPSLHPAAAAEISSANSLLGAYNLPPDVFATIYSLTKQNMRIQAIRVLRLHTGLGLSDAKAVIDRLALLVSARAAPGQCYIATACYGDGNHPDVVTLRKFRDETLLTNLWGRAFVRVYYALSPGLASRLGKDSVPARILRRRFLAPLVRRIRAR